MQDAGKKVDYPWKVQIGVAVGKAASAITAAAFPVFIEKHGWGEAATRKEWTALIEALHRTAMTADGGAPPGLENRMQMMVASLDHLATMAPLFGALCRQHGWGEAMLKAEATTMVKRIYDEWTVLKTILQ